LAEIYQPTPWLDMRARVIILLNLHAKNIPIMGEKLGIVTLAIVGGITA